MALKKNYPAFTAPALDLESKALLCIKGLNHKIWGDTFLTFRIKEGLEKVMKQYVLWCFLIGQ